VLLPIKMAAGCPKLPVTIKEGSEEDPLALIINVPELILKTLPEFNVKL
jgi:hypothetical protein